MAGITMKYFKNEDGETFGLEVNGSQDFLIKPDWVECDKPSYPLDPVLVAKRDRDNALQSLLFTTSGGDVIQCREADEQAIRNAVEKLDRDGLSTRTWFSVTDTPVQVSRDDLAAAVIAGQDQGAAIWDEFFAAVGGV